MGLDGRYDPGIKAGACRPATKRARADVKRCGTVEQGLADDGRYIGIGIVIGGERCREIGTRYRGQLNRALHRAHRIFCGIADLIGVYPGQGGQQYNATLFLHSY